MKNLFFFCIVTLVVFVPMAKSEADVITIAGYDIVDAVESGHGGSWSHTFDGNITSGASFSNFGFAGTVALYDGVGSGTLNDGIISTSESGSQLFINGSASDGTAIDPLIALTLPTASAVDYIELYGGDIPSNGIPGVITGVTVGLLMTDFTLVSETFSTTDFGIGNLDGIPVNDRIDLAGSSLENVDAFAVFLSGFQGDNSNWISLSEVRLFSPVPEPGSATLLGIGLTGLLFRRVRKPASKG